MTAATTKAGGFRIPLFQGLLTIKGSRVPGEIIAGKNSLNDFAFTLDNLGHLHVTGKGEEIVEDAMALVPSSEVRGLPGFIGHHW